MGRLLGNPYGEIRGKVGGGVFSRNKGGANLRVYAKPTNTNSIAQRIQRNLFRAMSGIWDAVSQAQRQGWNEFAKTTFNPLLKTNTGNMSGVNAIKANYNAINGVNTRKITMAVLGDAVGAAEPTYADCVFSYDAPVYSVRPNILSDTDVILPLQIANAVVNPDGAFTCDINFLGVDVAGIVNNQLADENGIKYSLGFFLSDSVKADGSKPKSLMMSCLGHSGIMTFAAGKLAGSKKVSVTVLSNPLIYNVKSFPMVGSWCYLTLVITGSNGTQTIASTVSVQITV